MDRDRRAGNKDGQTCMEFVSSWEFWAQWEVHVCYGAHQYEKFINWTVTCRNGRLIRQYSELDVYSVILIIVIIEPSD